MKKLDNMHISFREIDGYNKPYNFIISSREAGKSTQWILKAYKNFQQGFTTLVLRRNIVDISDAYIESIENVLKKFINEDITFQYKKMSLKDGVVMIKIEKKIFMCIVGLSAQISRIKSLVLPNIRMMVFDEFIVNPNFKEKYLPNEADKFKEVYNTFYRETEEKLKCYFLGNPYSHYNPYFLWLNIDTTKLKEGALIQGSNYVIWCYKLSEELKEYILARNPLYEFDDAYTRYAFNSQAICDENIRLSKLPMNYSLQFLFKSENKIIGIYRNNNPTGDSDRYFCKFESNIANNRNAFCFDFSEIINKCMLVSYADKLRFASFKKAMQKNLVLFDEIAVYYLIIDIYYFI